jgi:hypothetical protein
LELNQQARKREDNMNEGLENIKQIEDLENKVKTLSDHLADMCCQADEDTPSEYRTEHFRSTMDDAYEYLEKIGYFKRDK